MERIFITPNEAAKILHITPDTIRFWCRTDPEFPSMKVGAHYKINKLKLQEWADKKCKEKSELKNKEC